MKQTKEPGPTAYSAADAAHKLEALIDRALDGEEIRIIGESGGALRLVPISVSQGPGPRRPGSGRGQLLHMAADSPALPDEFKDLV